jgi:hypothetical protein
MATPFSTFFWTALKYMQDGVEADDIEWDMMPNAQIRTGKKEVMAFCWSGGFGSKKEPVAICNVATTEWGVWEYWNIGTLTEGIIEFAKQSKWPFPKDLHALIGRKYKVPVCFVYRVNSQGKIDLVREYLDVGSVMAQFE